jgi:hypothetical protein
MPGAVAMQHFRAHGRCSSLCPASAPSQHALQVGRDCPNPTHQLVKLREASLSSTPSTERYIAAAHPLLLPLPPMPTVATHTQRQQQHRKLSTYTLARTVGIGVCLLCDEPLGDEGKESWGGGLWKHTTHCTATEG